MRIEVEDLLGQIVHKTPISKICKVKWQWNMAQTVEQLLCKYEALSLNPSTTLQSVNQ
jgi:hypothetical protein